MDLQNNNRSVFGLKYLVILKTEELIQVINDDVSKWLYRMFILIGQDYNVTLWEWNYGLEFIEIMFLAEPKTEITKFLTVYKTMTSKQIKVMFPNIEKCSKDNQFWSKGLYLITLEYNSSIELRCQYIKKQDPLHEISEVKSITIIKKE